MQSRSNFFSRRRFLLSAAALTPAARLLQGQARKDTTFSADVNVVNVLATVRDKQGAIARELSKDDFLLDEDGRPQVIRYFARESNLPLTLGLLIDTSGSQRRVLGEERTASYRFLDEVLTGKDQAFVIHFDRDVELLQDLTSSRKKLEDALAKIEMAEQQRPRPQRGDGRRSPGRGYPGGGRQGGGGGTSLYDAVLLASDELMSKQGGRKALILLTDGVDVGSKVGISRAIEAAQRADTLVYGVRIADPEAYNGMGHGQGRRGGMGGGNPPYVYGDRMDGKKVLQRLSGPSGGSYFEVSSKEPVDKIYSRIQDELRNQYSLGYTSDRTDAGPGYRRIHLTTKQKGLAVQAREGYYARN
ncbi:MAG TPA: VWA domain-containing protein [Bryobacteraceae bacterium]|nr:VWA domain-containing protein [Bryobacteraceae bacterium]